MAEAVGPDTDAPLGFVLAAAARKLAKFYTAALSGRPISPSQLVVLRRLWGEDGTTLRDLAPRAALDPTSLNWIADQLEKGGFVERRRDDRDRRSVRLWLTTDGRRLESDLAPELERWETAIGAELGRFHDAAEIRAFRAVLGTLVTVLPEGEDLWATAVADVDARLESLRRLLEGEGEERAESVAAQSGEDQATASRRENTASCARR